MTHAGAGLEARSEAEWRAHLLGNGSPHVGDPRFVDGDDLVQQRAALVRRRAAVGRECRARGGDRLVDILGRAKRDLADRLLVGRVDHRECALFRRLHPLAADQELAAVRFTHGDASKGDGWPWCSRRVLVVKRCAGVVWSSARRVERRRETRQPGGEQVRSGLGREAFTQPTLRNPLDRGCRCQACPASLTRCSGLTPRRPIARVYLVSSTGSKMRSASGSQCSQPLARISFSS